MSNVRYWLWFVMAFHPGNKRIWDIIAPFKDVRKAYEAVCSGEHPSLNATDKKYILSTHIEQCDSIIEYCDEKGYRIITFEDENYPPLLRNIYDPPAVLFCMGNIENFNEKPAVASVGTRNPSEYSVDAADRICSELVRRGFAIVSGFALGLDSVAHRAALRQKGGCTAAVLACGLDYDYPKENVKFKKVIAVNGVVLTEYLPGTRPDKMCFQLRNRIISGMCFGTLVTEASELSGALITAAHAAEQGRSVFCIPPGDIFDKRYSGVIKFIRDGAVCTFSHLDILYDYYTQGCFRRKHDGVIRWPELYGEDDIPVRDSREKKKPPHSAKGSAAAVSADKAQEREPMRWEELFDELDEEQQTVVKCLEKGELPLDEICRITDIETFKLMQVVTELEMMNAAELTPEQKFRLL